MTINIENLEIIPYYSIEWVTDETGKHPIINWQSIHAISQYEDAKVFHTIDILPLLSRDQITEIEEKILEKL